LISSFADIKLVSKTKSLHLRLAQETCFSLFGLFVSK
jgi:hypothetical protein